MTDHNNVITFPPQEKSQQYDPNAPISHIISRIEQLLEDAKSGELRGLVFAAMYPEKRMNVSIVTAPEIDRFQTVASTVYLQNAVMQN